jgi:Inner membrane component of T3SS, cytoplasmic domain
MAPLGYIEKIDAKGNVLERIRIDALPIHVGRAYSNDVVVDDPYVCPLHLAIESDEHDKIIARDLNSVNGLYASADGKRVASLELESGSRFRIGHTLMRYRSIDQPLAPTLIDREGAGSRLASPYVAVITGFVVFALLCLDSYLGAIERLTVAKVISEPLTSISILLVWAGVWSLASRIVVSRLHFFEHATIAGCAILSFVALSASAEWLEFLFPVIPALWIAGLVGTGLILAGLVYNHLRFASLMRRRSRLWAALAVSTAMVGVSVISDYAGRSKFSNVMEFTGIVKPIDAAWVPAISVDRFIDNNQRLESDLEALARKAKAPQP